MFWTELLFSKLPLYDKGIKAQIFLRFAFLLAIWLTGLILNLIHGTAFRYLSNYQLYLPFFSTGMIVLIGAYVLQRELGKSVLSFRPLLDIDDSQYTKFYERLEHYCFSFIPVLLIAIVMFIFISGGLNIFLSPSLSIQTTWGFVIVFIIDLLTATGIWMGVAIWLTIFLISKEPLKVDLSHDLVNKFRSLTTMALWCSLFYFIALSLGLVIPFSINPSVMINALFYPLVVFILIGVLGIMLPFYNIHNALLLIKKKELNNIEAEFELLQTQFNELFPNVSGTSEDNTIPLMRKFFTLQLRERQIKLAQEWPIDISFISKLFLLVLIPVIVRLITWIIMGQT